MQRNTKQPRGFGWEGCRDGCQSSSGKNPLPLAEIAPLSPPGERDAFPRIEAKSPSIQGHRHLCPTLFPFTHKEIRTLTQSEMEVVQVSVWAKKAPSKSGLRVSGFSNDLVHVLNEKRPGRGRGGELEME